MVRHYVSIVPVDASLVPSIEAQKKACEFLADAFPYRSGRWQNESSLDEFPSVGDIDFTEHPEEALANPHYVGQTRFSIAIDNHRALLTDAQLEQLETLLDCSLRQSVFGY